MEKLTSKDYFGNREHFYVEKKNANNIPLHSHDYFELEFVLEGAGIQILNGTEYPLKRGSLYLLTPSDFHKVVISEKNTVWNLAFDSTMIPENKYDALFSAKNMFCQLNEEETFKIDMVMSVLSCENEDRKRVLPLLEYALDYVLPESMTVEEKSHINRAILFMETYFRESPSLERTAREVGLSTAYFGNLFKKTVGETYVSYLNRCKINCAKMLLENGKMVTETCFESGFGSLSGFLYTFRKTVGISPEAYRENHLAKKS